MKQLAAGGDLRRSPARVSVWSRLTELGGWLVIVPLFLVAAARVAAWDSRAVLVGLNAITPVLFLLAWPVAVFAGVLRRWALLAVACVVIVAQVGFSLPELLAATDVPTEARFAPRLRLFNANVLAGNNDVTGYADEIRRSRPDLVVLQESTPAFLAALEDTGVMRDLPHRVTIARTDPFAAMIASRWPLTEDDIVSADGRPILVRATVAMGAQTIRLFAFHAVAPTGGHLDEWKRELAALGKAVAVERRPVLIAGDFNATWGNRSFRQLLDLGLTDAAAARGKPFQMTWPRDRRVVPPLLRVDHVLTTKPLVVTEIRSGTGRGSDHRSIVADVAFVGPTADRI